jgi:hypothetical protein
MNPYPTIIEQESFFTTSHLLCSQLVVPLFLDLDNLLVSLKNDIRFTGETCDFIVLIRYESSYKRCQSEQKRYIFYKVPLDLMESRKHRKTFKKVLSEAYTLRGYFYYISRKEETLKCFDLGFTIHRQRYLN